MNVQKLGVPGGTQENISRNIIWTRPIVFIHHHFYCTHLRMHYHIKILQPQPETYLQPRLLNHQEATHFRRYHLVAISWWKRTFKIFADFT